MPFLNPYLFSAGYCSLNKYGYFFLINIEFTIDLFLCPWPWRRFMGKGFFLILFIFV